MKIYVEPFPPTGLRHELYVAGPNISPHKVAWSPDGKELFYVPRIRELEAVSITTEPTFAFGSAVSLPRPFQTGAPNSQSLYDVAPNGKFVGFIPAGRTDSVPRSNRQIEVVLNWYEELKARVPVTK